MACWGPVLHRVGGIDRGVWLGRFLGPSWQLQCKKLEEQLLEQKTHPAMMQLPLEKAFPLLSVHSPKMHFKCLLHNIYNKCAKSVSLDNRVYKSLGLLLFSCSAFFQLLVFNFSTVQLLKIIIKKIKQQMYYVYCQHLQQVYAREGKIAMLVCSALSIQILLQEKNVFKKTTAHPRQ